MSTTTGDVRTAGMTRSNGVTTDSTGYEETKPFAKTSEFLVWVLVTAAILVMTYVDIDRQLSVHDGWMYVTIAAGAYMVSRGLAKAGSHHRDTHRTGY
jgi:hypothetical protein